MKKLSEAASRYTSEISKWYSEQVAIIQMVAEVAEHGLNNDEDKKMYTTSVLEENTQFVDLYVAYEDRKFISGTDIENPDDYDCLKCNYRSS